jgi:hypothetical protein
VARERPPGQVWDLRQTVTRVRPRSEESRAMREHRLLERALRCKVENLFRYHLCTPLQPIYLEPLVGAAELSGVV